VNQWSHCPGKGNPADLMTRGVYAGELVSSSQWLTGPSWLARPLGLSKEDVSLEQLEPFLQTEVGLWRQCSYLMRVYLK
jgi:hypothetical protein